MLLLFCSQSSFMSHANTSIPTAELSFAISSFPPSGEASMSLQWSEQSWQQNPQRSHAVEQMMQSHAESKSPPALGQQLCAPSFLGALFEQHPAKLGALLSTFCFSFKRRHLVYRIHGGKGGLELLQHVRSFLTACSFLKLHHLTVGLAFALPCPGEARRVYVQEEGVLGACQGCVTDPRHSQVQTLRA